MEELKNEDIKELDNEELLEILNTLEGIDDELENIERKMKDE